MKVQLKQSWESKISSIKPKLYPLKNNNWRIVDETFDEMHKQRRLKFITELTPFRFLIFIVSKADTKSNKKSRTVVDIQKLNELVLLDSHPLPLQSEIIANVSGCTNLVVLDVISFFYQWCLYLDHCFMFIVIIHYGQKIFQVPIMGYINLVAYV